MSAIVSIMRKEIERIGAISFAKFMELALYAPGEGYYERRQTIGARGDFYTSVSVGSLFGELLAFQFARWFSENWDAPVSSLELPAPPLQLIEAGAHDGRLACDILNWIREFSPEIFSKLEYWIVEPSERRRAWQAASLAGFQNVKWADDLSVLSGNNAGAYRIIFSNELLDAMPAHRIGWDKMSKSWFEWGVYWNGEGFGWTRLPNDQRSEISFPSLVPGLSDVLFDQFSTEVCPAASRWWSDAAKLLCRGKIVGVDYGLLAEEFLVPERRSGTLRAFFRHHASSDLLARPGEQDLTAQVNFSELKIAGENLSLNTEALIAQASFLTEISRLTWRNPDGFGDWDANRRRQFQTLTHPEHLGRPFRVLIQSR